MGAPIAPSHGCLTGMDVLILGGTAWLGRAVANAALTHGHRVTCLARGESGSAPDGVEWVRGDRTRPQGYAGLDGRTFDAVVDLARQPGQVRTAVDALAGAVDHWVFVSTVSVYADHSEPGGNESAELLPAASTPEVEASAYGEGKVACEQILSETVGDRLLITRPGIIGGPGDHSGRTVAYAERAHRRRRDPMLIPDAPAQPTQVIDVRDLVDFLLAALERRLTGTYDLVGPVVPLAEWIELSRQVGSHNGEVIAADPTWLADHEVGYFAGPGSLALWLPPHMGGMGARTGSAAMAAGLRHRPRVDLLADTLAWDLEQGIDREISGPGLRATREAELIAAWGERTAG